ncbi:MAG: phage tail length tape measure family protein [Xanthomonadales bacterium]|nr:phage tail length tape measure family protein [Xanthomonadales bacterium]
MNTNRDFIMDLRMNASFEQAQKSVGDMQSGLDDMAASAQAAAEAMSEVTDSAAIENAEASQRSYAQAARATQAAIAEEIGMIGELQERLERGASSWEELADTEAMLDKAMSKGLVTAEEYDEALKSLDKSHGELQRTELAHQKSLDGTVQRYDKTASQLQRLAKDEAALKAAVDEGRISREAYNRAVADIAKRRATLGGADQEVRNMRRLNLESVGVQRNLTQLLTYTATGNWQMAGNQILQLGNQAGTATVLLSGLGLTAGIVAGSVLALAVGATKGYLEMRALETAIIATGNAAGVTAGQVDQMTQDVGAATGAYGDADKAAAIFLQSGEAVGETLQEMIRTAVNLSELTGQSIEQTSAQVLRLAREPVPALVELNKQYNFLTLEVYNQVRALQDQGREQEAVRVAMEALERTTTDRVSQMREQAGSLEKAWRFVKEEVLEVIEALKDVGKEGVDANLRSLDRMQEVVDGRNLLGAFGGPGGLLGGLYIRSHRAEMSAYIASRREQLELTKASNEEDARSQAAREQEKKDAVEAAKAIDDRVASVDRAAAKQRELNELIRLYNQIAVADPADARLFDGSYERLKKAVEDKYAEKPTRKSASGTDPNEQAAREVLNLQRQIALLGELEAGETKAAEAARIRYEIEEGAYKNASPALKQQLVDNAQLLDSEQRRIEAAKQMVQVRLEIARLSGQPVPPELDETTQRLSRLRQELENIGKAAEAADITRLLNMRQAATDMEAVQREYQQVMGELQIAQQRIQLGVQSGLKTEAQAQREIAQLYRDKLVVLDELVPRMEAAAKALGSPEALAGVQRIKAELEGMRANVDLLQQSIGSTFEGAFSSALQKVATSTASLGEAVRGFLSDLATGMARYASEQLAAIARAKLMQVLQKAAGATDVQQGAAELTVAAGATAAAGGAIALGATQLQAAADTLLIANSMSAFGGFAEGGWTGPGGKYTPRGIVHADEYVMPKETVHHYGLNAMRAIHARSVALDHLGSPSVRAPVRSRLSYAEGGLVRSEGLGRPTVNLRNYNLLDPALFGQFLDTADGDGAMMNWISRNASAIKQVTG